MPEIAYAWLAIIAGFVGLVWGADRFVGASAAIADRLGISKMVIGLTVVAFGTSAPEIAVSISSALKDQGALAVGNALGSNLANMGLVLGLTALISPLPVAKELFRRDIPILLIVMIISGICLFDGGLSRAEGAILVLLLIPVLWIMSRNNSQAIEEIETDSSASTSKQAFWLILGLTVLVVSAEKLVWGAKEVAMSFHVSERIIGLTIVAIGTSLPELAASVVSALKGRHDIAIGNVVGSNIFNLLAVMGIAPVINAISMEANVFYQDFLTMFGMTLLLAGFMIASLNRYQTAAKIGRTTGIALLVSYTAYFMILFNP